MDQRKLLGFPFEQILLFTFLIAVPSTWQKNLMEKASFCITVPGWGEHYVTREGMAAAGRLVPLYPESGNRELEHRLGYRVILKLMLFLQQEISEIFTTFQTGP